MFLLSKAGTEVFLGNIFIRSGAGEFRAVVDAKNVEGKGGGLDTYYGLTIHDVKNPWRSYTTIWGGCRGAGDAAGIPSGDHRETEIL